jgi:uncharacterized membrane protein YkgB
VTTPPGGRRSGSKRWAHGTPVSGLAAAGSSVTRYGLVTTLMWIGALEFTDYEVQNAKPLVTAEPADLAAS